MKQLKKIALAVAAVSTLGVSGGVFAYDTTMTIDATVLKPLTVASQPLSFGKVARGDATTAANLLLAADGTESDDGNSGFINGGGSSAGQLQISGGSTGETVAITLGSDTVNLDGTNLQAKTFTAGATSVGSLTGSSLSSTTAITCVLDNNGECNANVGATLAIASDYSGTGESKSGDLTFNVFYQ